MEKALCLLTGYETLETTGCGRTDTGVHASDFYLHVDLETKLRPGELLFKLNRVLPADIAVKNILPVHAEAHARFDATQRSYQYHVHHQKDPFINETSVYLHRQPDYDKMNQAAAMLLDHNDFACFCKSNAGSSTTLCKVNHAQWKAVGPEMIFYISADRFLRNMVRAIVGTLLPVGYNDLSLHDFKSILNSKDRRQAGESVAAHGLCLTQVQYPYIPHG